MKKIIQLIISILLISILAINNVQAGQKSTRNINDINELLEDIQFTFSIDETLNKDKKLPIITIYMQYNGDGSRTILWDERFYFLLWDKTFLLEIKSEEEKSDTSKLHNMTGGLYYPNSKYYLYKGIILTSILDFNDPGPCMFCGPRKGKNILNFYIQDKDGNLKKIGNELIVNIE
ncbi:MAG: hypothetical protein ABH952_06680 [Candidatus Omnitrophota bacterium]